MTEQKSQDKENFRYFVRIANTDLDGNKYILHAMKKIEGISFMLANAVCNMAGVEKTIKTGYLKDDDVKKLDEVMNNLLKHNIPSWMLNRRNNYEDGKDYHLIKGNLSFAEENDVKRMKKIRSYRGVRHGLGLPVRGQFQQYIYQIFPEFFSGIYPALSLYSLTFPVHL